MLMKQKIGITLEQGMLYAMWAGVFIALLTAWVSSGVEPATVLGRVAFGH
jgi:hypothetical protein